MTKYSTLISTSAIALAMIATPAYAQIEDEIIVTATKRQTTLQDTPVAVTVTNAETIEKAQIKDILDLQSVVPSLRVSQLQNSVQTNFIIRGFGNGANNAGIEPSVGVFIDGVYRSRSAAQIGDLPVVERVEVLRGPQSTLFGKNASAGVISVVSAKPSFDPFGYVEGTLGNYDTRQGKAYITGPISDNVAFSLGGNFNKRDGYADAVTFDEEGDKSVAFDLNDRDRFGLRAQMLFQPVDTLEFRLIGDYDRVEETCCYAPNLVNGPTGDAVPFFGGTVLSDPFDYETTLNFEPNNEVENYGLSFQGDLEFGDHTLTSITAYRNSAYSDNGDVDFTNAALVGSNRGTLDIDTFTQELRLSSNYEGRFNWLAGIFYFDESLTQTDDITYDEAFRPYVNVLADSDPTDGITDLVSTLEFLSGNAPGTFLQAGQGVFETSGQDNRAINLFGQVDFDITDRLTFTAGASYTDDNKSTSLSQRNTDAFSNTDFVTANNGTVVQAFFGQAFFDTFNLAPTPQNIANIEAAFPGTTAAITAGVVSSIQNDIGALQFLPQLQGYPNAFEDGSSKDDNIDYNLRLSYEVSDTLNVYAGYATGYKSTSWNLSRDSRPTPAELAALFPNDGQPFNLEAGGRRADPEESKVLEVGVKAKFSKGSINLAVFDQSIKNFQSNVFVGDAFQLANAEKQSVRGVEVDAMWYPVDSLTVNIGATYLDPKYDSFTNSAFGDISGTRPAGIPELSTSIAATYDFDLGGRDTYIRADWQRETSVDHQDGEDLNLANATLTEAGYPDREISLFNASAGIAIGELDLSIWGRNLFNDEFITTTFATVAQPGSFNGYANQPRTYGLTGRYNF